MPRKPDPRAWNEHNDQEWMTKVTKTFKREDADEVVTFHGLCPDCLDETTVELPRPPRYELYEEKVGSADPAPDTARHWCNCTGDHPGRPTDRHGCGVYGYATAD